jgi:hypothetical protein
MPRPPLPDEDIEALEEILRSDPKLPDRSVRKQYVIDHGEEGAPAERTINKYLSPLRQKLKNRRDEDPVRPLDQWNGNPDENRILFAAHRVATNVCAKYEIRDFEGLTERHYKWAEKLSPFFNLSDYFETAWLLDFALRFADDEKFFTDTDRKFVPRVSATNLLEKWQWRSSKWSQAKQRATVAPWEMGDDVEQRIAIALGYQPPIYRPSSEDQSGQPQVSDPTPEKEGASQAEEEELLDGAYRVIGETTTDQMIMPIGRPSSSSDEQTALTQDIVSKLVSELLEDPGILSRERAAELGMELVATLDEILNRHVGKQEGEKN